MAGMDRQSPQGTGRRSGTGRGEDPTNMPGQYPASIFGMTVPQTSGARGTPPAKTEPESINQPGQYPDTDPFTGVHYTQAGEGANQPPGSAGRNAADQSVTSAAQYQDIGSVIYGVTEQDHMMKSAPSRPDGMYPPTTETLAVQAPSATGAGGGSVRGPGHPNAGK
jgi:hypothetical protein